MARAQCGGVNGSRAGVRRASDCHSWVRVREQVETPHAGGWPGRANGLPRQRGVHARSGRDANQGLRAAIRPLACCEHAWVLTLPTAPLPSALLVGLLSADGGRGGGRMGVWALATPSRLAGARGQPARAGACGVDGAAEGWDAGAGLRLRRAVAMLRVRGGMGEEEPQGGPAAREALQRGQECMARFDFVGAVAAFTSVRAPCARLHRPSNGERRQGSAHVES